MAQILEKREGTKRQGEKRAAPGEGGGCFCLARRAEREGEGVFVVPTQGSKIPSGLN